MTYWKAWFDVRTRFVLCAVLFTVVLVTSAFDTGPEEFDRNLEAWINGGEQILFATLAIVLAVGGTTTEVNARSNLMTLSLPTPRSRWLVSQWLVVTLLTFCLTMWIFLLVAMAGPLSGNPVPLGALLGAALLHAFVAALWVWPAILGTSIMKGAVRAALVVVILLVISEIIRSEPAIEEWHIGRLADLRVWQEGLPWQALLVGLVLAGGSAWLTLRRFQRTDY